MQYENFSPLSVRAEQGDAGVRIATCSTEYCGFLPLVHRGETYQIDTVNGRRFTNVSFAGENQDSGIKSTLAF